jgi:hypothetical protein
MIELPIHIHKKKFDLDQHICDKFADPIIFYLGHKLDRRNLLITFVLVNFKSKEYTYITTYSIDNINTIEADAKERLLKIESHHNPHCTIVLNPDEDFHTFVEQAGYFYYVNMKKKILRVITGDDLSCDESGSIVRFGSTFYKDDEDDRLFYFTVLIQNNSDRRLSKVNYYKSDLRLEKIKKIHETKGWQTPHVTRKYKQTLLNSDFYTTKFKLVNSGREFSGKYSLLRYIYRSIYNNYCRMTLTESTDKGFAKAVNMDGKKPAFSFFFSLYLKYKYGKKDVKQICDSEPELTFTALPGYITLIDLDTDRETSYETTAASPAHFEIDTDTSNVYVSSHNFADVNRIYYLGPAAIDKFNFHNGELAKIGTFQIPDGYRYTTHKFFRNNGKSYLCTFSQPNRLLLIDAETMTLIHHEDIGIDVLSKAENVLDFINYNNLEPITIKTIEVSADGEILFFIGYDGIYFYDFSNRKIITRIPYIDSTVLFDDVALNQFYKRTTHTQYFK